MAFEPKYATDAEVTRIDAAIRGCGACLIKEEQLKMLFPETNSHLARLVFLADLAVAKGWSFEFQPHDGDVRIASLPSNGMDGNNGEFSDR